MAQSVVGSGDSRRELEKMCLLLSLGGGVCRGPLCPGDHGTMSSTVPSLSAGSGHFREASRPRGVDSSDSPSVQSVLVSGSSALCCQAHACSGLLTLLGEEPFIIT